jgi:molybdopterin/thiamine biosynthesis adenylyltransferase
MADVGRVTLIDRDVYEAQNLVGQDITAAEVGETKARVQSRRIQRIAPELEVEAIADSVEDIPVGAMRSDVILAGLDSKRARQIVNERAWLLGVPWVDGGVEADGLLARATVYLPGENAPCIECAWGPRDYETIEQQFPCGGGRADVPATRAPSALGGLAASLVAIEAERLLSGVRNPDDSGHSILVDARHGRSYPTTLVFNTTCLMPGHRDAPAAVIGECRDDIALGEILDGAGSLRVPGQSFATALTCGRCGDRCEEVRLIVSLRTRPAPVCSRCGGEMVASGFDTTDELRPADLPARVLSSSLRDLGIRPRDWLRASAPDGVARILEVVDKRSCSRGTREGGSPS